MSAITEYVHYNQKNYDNWGINRVNTIKSDSMTNSFEQMRNRITNIGELNKLLQQAQKIEQDYNQIFFPSQQTQFSQLLAEAAQETLYQQFGAAAGTIDKSSFDVKRNQVAANYKNKIKAVREKINIANLKDNATEKQMLDRINKLNNVLLNLEDAKNSDILKTRIKNAQNQLSQIKNKLQKQAGLKNINFSKDISTINKLIQEFNRSFTWYNQRGDLFEWLLPLIQLKSTDLTGKELKAAMKELIGSGNVGATKISISFADFLNMPEEQLSISLQSKKFEMQIEDVRSRTDVKIKYATGQGKIKELAVSAKSVTGNHVKLIDETSLYRVLVFSENYDFIKHYLNIISESKGGKASSDQIVQANRLVKGLIMQLAAEGFDLNNPAQLLIIHNVKEKKINVYNIKALVYLIQQQIINGNNKYNNLIKAKGSYSFNDNFTIKQQFEETVEQRLNFLFNEINKIKITAHIYGTQLKNYLKALENI